MIFVDKVKTGLKDVGKDCLIKNESILEILENVGGEHSNLAGYGILDIERTKLSWILLDWKVKVLKRPLYADELEVKTWGRCFQKACTYRDFEIYNSKGELCVIATSKWAMINIETRRIVRMGDEIKGAYLPEEQYAFEEEVLSKPEVPIEFSNEFKYTVSRKDIDINGHMHNTYYLNLAYEVLPEEVYNERPYDSFRITYKHEIKLGDTVVCKYAYFNNKHVVVVMNEDGSVVNSIIELAK